MIVFELSMQLTNCIKYCLLIMDNHSSHIIVNFNVFCMQNIINLLIILLYCSHLVQSLDINVFVSLKHTLKKLMQLINIIQIVFHTFFE